MISEPQPRRRYFDNAATSFPKPPAVWEAMQRYATELGASPGRGAYREVIETGRLAKQAAGSALVRSGGWPRTTAAPVSRCTW